MGDIFSKTKKSFIKIYNLTLEEIFIKVDITRKCIKEQDDTIKNELGKELGVELEKEDVFKLNA